MLYQIAIALLVAVLLFEGVGFYLSCRKTDSAVEKKTLLMKVVREIVFYSAFLAICVFLFTKVLIHGYVPSESMRPTLEVGDHVLVYGGAYWWSEPERGDIVVFQSEELDEVLIKRLVGLPGDRVSFAGGNVYINDELYEEPYLEEDLYTASPYNYVVPEGCYFFLGDNRNGSFDSRYWDTHYIEKSKIIGKYLFTMFNRVNERLNEQS